jgi:hypothetical protein
MATTDSHCDFAGCPGTAQEAVWIRVQDVKDNLYEYKMDVCATHRDLCQLAIEMAEARHG